MRNSRPLPDVDQDMSGARRRTLSGWLLVVAFVVVPLVEIYVIIQVGQVIGAWWTILLLIADSILGSWLVKREGGRAWRALRTALGEGRMPARELADGMLILLGGAFILSPGFVLDAVGLLCILPLTRPVGRRILSGVISRKLVGVSFATSGRTNAGSGAPYGPAYGGTRSGPDDAVVEGQVVEDRGVDDQPEPPR
jgi:UPF0716 protein FxsA